MSDVNENNELSDSLINVEDVDISSMSEFAENEFDKAEVLIDDLQNEDIAAEQTNELSSDFSFDDLNDDEITNFFENYEDEKQEPYFENKIDDFTETGSVVNDSNQESKEVEENFVKEKELLVEAVEAVESEEAVVKENMEQVADNEVLLDALIETVTNEEEVAEESVEPIVKDEVLLDASVEAVANDEEAVEEVSLLDDSLIEDVENVGAFSVVPSSNSNYIQWYSGDSALNVYQIDRSSVSGEFVGSDEYNTIHVNVGYDTYGWNVHFSNGVVMSLRDVREYQVRNGKLPDTSGSIVYGQNTLSFKNVERIVVYEAVKYFSYGV